MHLSVASVVVACLAAPAALAAAPPFKHIVIVIQENRTPDNLFGSNPSFEPGVDIASSGISSTGSSIPLAAVPLAGCYDIDHTHAAFEAALTQGFDQEHLRLKKCKPPASPQFKYADNSDGTVQPYFDLASQYGFANRMFQTNQGPSFPAHQFLFGGTSAPSPDTPLFVAENPVPGISGGCTARTSQLVAIINGKGSETANKPTYPCFDHPALGDVLDAASPPLSWRYYAAQQSSIWTAPNALSHICEPGLVHGRTRCTGKIWTKHVVSDNSAQVLTDISACALPAVSWVVPTGRESDHASINDGTGPQWVASIVNAVGKQACPGENYWNDTAVIITWDDWGGWYDHVAPFDIAKHLTWGAGYTYGFRVPLLVVSAFTPAGTVSNAILDFGSILYFVEQNFGLGFIGPGTDTYTHYADYQAAGSSRGSLSDFFSLTAPRKFNPIASKLSARDFINEPKSDVGPDDE